MELIIGNLLKAGFFVVLPQAFERCEQGASTGRLYATCLHHPALHRPGKTDALGRERRVDQALHVNGQ